MISDLRPRGNVFILMLFFSMAGCTNKAITINNKSCTKLIEQYPHIYNKTKRMIQLQHRFNYAVSALHEEIYIPVSKLRLTLDSCKFIGRKVVIQWNFYENNSNFPVAYMRDSLNNIKSFENNFIIDIPTNILLSLQSYFPHSLNKDTFSYPHNFCNFVNKINRADSLMYFNHRAYLNIEDIR
jgi:hypothetical protein